MPRLFNNWLLNNHGYKNATNLMLCWPTGLTQNWGKHDVDCSAVLNCTDRRSLDSPGPTCPECWVPLTSALPYPAWSIFPHVTCRALAHTVCSQRVSVKVTAALIACDNTPHGSCERKGVVERAAATLTLHEAATTALAQPAAIHASQNWHRAPWGAFVVVM